MPSKLELIPRVVPSSTPLGDRFGDVGSPSNYGLSPVSRLSPDYCRCALLRPYRKLATRSACSSRRRALSASSVPAGSPLTLMVGFDQTGRRGQPLQPAP